MKILALQLKRIGDAILTAPALAALRAASPEARITLAVHASCAPLLEMIPAIDSGIVFGPARGWTPWQQALTGGFDAVLDFTGTDRTAAASALTRAPLRATFEWVKKNRARALAYHRFIDSPVREFHTADHYAHLLRAVAMDSPALADEATLAIPATADHEATKLLPPGDFVVLHPGSARPEKYWLPERWAEVATHLHHTHAPGIVFTGGNDRSEQEHLAAIRAALPHGIPVTDLSGRLSLAGFAAVLARARLVISCDTAAVHFAAAFRRPQIALFGPTNPFHWRPRHERAVVISAALPATPLSTFEPRMKGAPMERIPTATVLRAVDALYPAVASIR